MSKNNKDTFTLWGAQSVAYNSLVRVELTREEARLACAFFGECRVVKLECRIVPPQRKPKRGKYPNDNFGLPAGYTPHNPNNLTREQVGEGFRLLADVEIGYHRQNIFETEAWQEVEWDSTGWAGCLSRVTYRVPINTPLDINPELK